MNRFIMNNAPPLTKKSTQTNTRTTAKNGAAKNRATQLERTTLHEDILSHIKRNLPKPQADGRLKMHSKEERALQFLPGDRKRSRTNIRKIEEIRNRKLNVGEPLETTNKGVSISIDELSIDDIKKLTRDNALKLCQFHKISNATNMARMAKNNNSRKLCYIEALCEYKINKKK